MSTDYYLLFAMLALIVVFSFYKALSGPYERDEIILDDDASQEEKEIFAKLERMYELLRKAREADTLSLKAKIEEESKRFKALRKERRAKTKK